MDRFVRDTEPERVCVADQPGAALYAVVSGNGNELNYDEKPDCPPDAVKFRFGTYGEAITISLDRLLDKTLCPKRREMAFIKIGHDDNYPKDVDVVCFEFFITTPEGEYNDAAQKFVARLGLAKGLEIAGDLPSPVPPPPSMQALNKIVSLDGRVELNVQNADALGLVLYFDGAAIWAAPIDPARMPRPTR